MVLVKELELLFDGRIRVIFFSGASVYLVPLIVANSFPDILLMRLTGQPAMFVNIDTTIETIDGVPFAGTFDDLETLIRQMAIDANIIFTGSVLNGGGGGDATAANQVLEIAATTALTKPTDSQYTSSRDVLEEIQITGQFRGKTAYAFNVIGQRSGFTSTSILQGLKEYDNGVADFAVTNNSTLDLVCSSPNDTAAGTGVRSVKVTYINASNNLVESASIPTNGAASLSVLTGVNQVLWMETNTAGSGGVAAGNINLRINGGAVQIEQITAGGNKSRSAIFMIPQGYTGYIKDWRVSAINNDQDCRLRGTVNTLDRSLATVYHYMSEKYAAANTSISPSNLWLKLPALSRVKVSTMSGGTAATVRCNTNFLIILIAD